MEYLQTLCFAGVNSKRKKIPAGKKRKGATVEISIATEFCMSQQTSKQIEKELGHENISFIATQRPEY